MMKQEIILLSEDAKMPDKGSTMAAAFDLYSPADYTVPAGKNMLIKTDIAVAWDNDEYYMQILSRSGMGLKHNVICICGICDYDYRKNVGVILQNNSSDDYHVKKHDRIAQYTFLKIAKVETEQVNEFSFSVESNRLDGFGSTGK